MAVRRESVVLELDDRFTTGMAIAAAKTEMLRRELERLDGAGSRGSRGVDRTTSSTEKMTRSVDKSEKSIDRLSGRMRILADVAAIVGPSVVPIAALGVPAITGLASAFGFAALGAGTMVAAFQGVGGALKAVNKAALEPTTANLDAARLAMAQIGPDAQRFVEELRSMQPALAGLRDSAAAGLFPGLTEGLDELQKRIPDVERIISAVSGELGQIGADTGASLASNRWDDFFTFMATDAPAALASMARAAGSTAHAMAELWMAFDPLNDSFMVWLEDATASLDQWASGLSETQGFQDFISYVQRTGPQVADTFAAIGNAVLQIAEAAAPLGGPVLQAIEGVANALATIANSDAGPTIMAAVTALAILSRAQAAYSAVAATSWATSIRGAETFGGKLAAARTPLLKGGAALAGLALASSDVAQKFDLSNTASLALMGTLGGPWGAAVGGAVGLVLDLGKSNSKVSTDVNGLTATLNQQTGAITANTTAFTAGELEKQGVLKAASDLGLNLSDVTQAALGNADAMSAVTSGLADAKAGFYNADGTIRVGSDTLRTFGDNMHLVQNAIGGSNEALSTGQARISRMGDAAGSAAGGVNQLSAAAQRNRAAMAASRQAASNVARQFLDISKSANDAKVSLNQWLRQMSRQADALNHFASNAQKAANKGLRQGLIKALQAMGPEGAMRMRQLANASEKEIARANRAWARGQRAARNYTDVVGGRAAAAAAHVARMRAEIERLRNKIVHVDQKGAEAARAKITSLRLEIDRLHNRDIYIRVHKSLNRGASGNVGLGSADNAIADGGTVPGARYPYADKVYAYLAPGEEVITNRHGEADRFRADRASGRIPHYADGGTVQRLANGGRVRGGDNGKDHDKLRDRIRRLTAAIEKSSKAIDKERTARDDLVSKRKDLASTVGGQFTSDLFGSQPANLSWMNPAQRQAALTGSVFDTLKSDIANANTFKSTLASLRSRGLDGQAFAALASSGDVQRAQAFAGLSSKQLGSYESLFNQRASAAAGVGAFAGNAVFGAQITQMNHTISKQYQELKGLRHDLKELQKKSRPIHVHDKSGSPHKTAKEVSRRQALG